MGASLCPFDKLHCCGEETRGKGFLVLSTDHKKGGRCPCSHLAYRGMCHPDKGWYCSFRIRPDIQPAAIKYLFLDNTSACLIEASKQMPFFLDSFLADNYTHQIIPCQVKQRCRLLETV